MNKDKLIANQYVYIKNLQDECESLEKRVKELEKPKIAKERPEGLEDWYCNNV